MLLIPFPQALMQLARVQVVVHFVNQVILAGLEGFALFQAESLIPREAQAQLFGKVMEMLKPVRPLVDSPVGRAV